MAKASTKIRNLDTLEKEIYRLRLEAKNTSEKLENNLDYLQHNYASMTMNSIFSRGSSKNSGGEGVKEKIFTSFWENEKVQKGINRIVDHLADKTVEGIESILDKILK